MSDLNRQEFGNDFVWGVAHASYQVEGAWDADGKGLSIWDTFTHRGRGIMHPRGTIRRGQNGDVACDWYHRYADDLALVKELGFDAQRFSISWPRVLPEGTGIVNRKGLDFCSRVVDTCLELGIEPWVTLYHWDLPEALHQQGGWTNRAVVGWFEEYVGVVAEALGDRVRHWMVFNEPLSFTAGGYLVGRLAPGKHGLRNYLAATHHVNLSQAAGARALRDRATDPVVGTSHVVIPPRTKGDSPRHERAARAADAFLNGVHIDPAFGLGYPVDACSALAGIRRYEQDGDDKAVVVDWDFVGVQYYTRILVRPAPVPRFGFLPKNSRNWARYDITAMGWEVQPDGLHEALAKVHAYGKTPRLYVTENGAAYPDHVEGTGDDARVHDPRRTLYYQQHLAEVLRARNDGIPVDGYFCWSIMDNFEWAEGYRPRFGLVYVDYATQQRIVKDTGYWFQSFLDGA